ncbi:polysaccharide deacetylase family protein [Cohnella sp. AR92]|uniref:polysaccharide deacetylase family protein n=1 Tax=Cohnella sp. AR92 TaxID=648716 RepID=UPI000F8D797D|nr:polysaccharide deacetylase family protein [Cohnella sp. AR92]RUS42609.1 polysaccharide deacetylase family protein [Cohnella sp. AR92]
MWNSLRRLVKHIIYFAFHYSGLLALFEFLLRPKGLFIVGYHRISEDMPDRDVHPLAVTRTRLDSHFRFYRKRFKVIGMDDVEKVLSQPKLDANYLVVTFDDGYLDNKALAEQPFVDYEVCATLYLTASPIDKREPLWTDKVDAFLFSSAEKNVTLNYPGLSGTFSLADNTDRIQLAERVKNEIKRYDETAKRKMLIELRDSLRPEFEGDDSLMLTWSDVGELAAAGVTLGSHTMNHPTLSRIPETAVVEELRDSRRLIEERTGIDVRHFAYPYGRETDFTTVVAEEARRHYRTAVTAINGINYPGQNLWELRRVIVENIPASLLRLRLLKLRAQDYIRNRR